MNCKMFGERHLHVIMACHNRRETTLSSLGHLNDAAVNAAVSYDITVFDDGSTDGTGLAIRERYPSAIVIHGDGSAYWAASMAAAEANVLSRCEEPGHYMLWLNDDTDLTVTGISRLLPSEMSPPRVRVGVTIGAEGEITYGLQRRVGWHPLSYRLENELPAAPLDKDSFNGNIVLVPVSVARALGGIDGEFQHSLADIDYGLRLSKAGIPFDIIPFPVGLCDRNVAKKPSGQFIREWKDLTSVKGGGNPHNLLRFMRRHTPARLPAAIGATYTIWALRTIRDRLGNWPTQ